MRGLSLIKWVQMIKSLVVCKPYHHITRADYHDVRPLLRPENVAFPKIGCLQSRFLAAVLSGGQQSHIEFYRASHSYRGSSYAHKLRQKGWIIVNHDKATRTADFVPRTVIYSDYELFADFSPELKIRVDAFRKLVNDFLEKYRKSRGSHDS